MKITRSVYEAALHRWADDTGAALDPYDVTMSWRAFVKEPHAKEHEPVLRFIQTDEPFVEIDLP